MYINDISASSCKVEFFLFGDDTNFLYNDKSLPLLESVVNEELINVCDWLLANKLTQNAKKSSYAIFHLYQRKLSNHAVINLEVFDNEHKAFRNLERKQIMCKISWCLDRQYRNYLSWNEHVANVALKISKTIGIIARLRQLLS